MKSIRTLAGMALAIGVVAGCSPAKPELHIYTWTDYISSSVIERFEKENDCRIVVDTFDSNESMYEKLRAGSTGYDIIMPSSYQIPLMIKNKLIRPLDHSKLPNVAKNFDKNFENCILDKSFSYNVPYAVTYTGFAYRGDKVGNAPINSWKIFGASALKGRMSLLSDMRETIGGGLMFLGYSLNSTNAEEIAKAVDVVIGWKRNIAKFDNEQYKSAVASGEFFVGHGYSSDIIQIMLDDGHVGFSLPKEGFVIAFDEMVVSIDSAQPDLAHKFIDFCYDPDVAAVNMTDVCAPMPVSSAFDKLDDKLRRLIVLDKTTLSRGQVLMDFADRPEIHNLYVKAWDKIKASK